MRAIKLNQKNFNSLVENLNHKVSLIERDIKWTKRIMGYMATLLTIMLIGSLL